MKLAFIGIGNVGFALANNLQKKGHEITIAHDDPKSESVSSAIRKNKAFRVLPLQEAIDASELVFLATPFKMNQAILKPLFFRGKTLVDCTNPVGPGLSHGLASEISGAEKVQEWANDARVVKAYTIYGYENLENSDFPEYPMKPAMFIAGDNSDSKLLVTRLNKDLGFETLDTGDLSRSLHLEHMTLLWVKMVRMDGHSTGLTWARLKR